jgi:Holliday junction DNA helicase RuvB
VVTAEIAQNALVRLDVDNLGLDEMDKRILDVIIGKFKGGPVGISTVAVAVAEEPGTIEEVYEPFLIQEGLLQRTPRGRVATQKAFEHLGVTRAAGESQGELF